MTNSEQIQLGTAKNNLYRDYYRRTIFWLVVMVVIGVVLAAGFVFLGLSTPQPKYYATMTSGRVVPLHSLSEPVITDKYLLRWAALATRAAYNLDFNNYKQQLKKMQPYFTTNGWNKFQEALKKAGLLNTVISKKLVMSSVVSGPPVILNQAVRHGRYTWRVELPLLVSFTSASRHQQNKLIITMNVSRVSTLQAPQGIQISDFKSQYQMQ